MKINFRIVNQYFIMAITIMNKLFINKVILLYAIKDNIYKKEEPTNV